jgi:hypothetical protein
MSEHSPKSNTTPLIKPSSKSNSTTLPKHKNSLPRATNSKQEQPIDIDPNTILRNSLITTNYYFDFQKKTGRGNRTGCPNIVGWTEIESINSAG